MSSSKVMPTIAAAVAVVCIAILIVAAKPVGTAEAIAGIVGIICISVIYFASLAGTEREGSEAESIVTAELLRAIDAMAEGEAVDLSLLPPGFADALSRLEGRIEVLSDDLSELSPRDQLTSLAKENVFNNVLWREFNRAQRYGEPMSLALIEIRGLDSVRASEGVEAVDDCLKSVASVVLQMVRETDFAARYGDAQLAVIMPGTAAAGAAEFAQRFEKLVAEGGADLGRSAQDMSVVVGTASLPEEGIRTAPELVQKAARSLPKAPSAD